MKFFKINIDHLSDEALMGRLKENNDPKALTELYKRYSKKLLGYFINMFSGDVAKSEDFLHDLFIKLMEKKHLFDANRKFYSWVFTVASNMCKTEFRKPIMKTLPIENSDSHQALQFEDNNKMDSLAFKSDLKAQIDLLSLDHKATFILRYHQQFSLNEIAEITESNLGTVKSRLYYATQKLTKSLESYRPENDSPQFKMN
ncbi:MAG: RNA polymerase sigma factor [Crocinitomicaceae bacterium]